jgi:UDP-N-acetylmuramoyl-L-alanyl-D-glutamate--2,6-diaminopimelate ligase
MGYRRVRLGLVAAVTEPAGTYRSLDDVLAALVRAGLLVHRPPELPAVRGLATDSRRVQPGDLFLALPGTVTDGHGYVDEAVRRGAVAVLVQQPVTAAVPTIVVRDSVRAARTVATTWFDDPAAGLLLAGVTGTNGKTTTTALLRHLLNEDGAAGSIGTLGAFDGAGHPVLSGGGTLTTPGPVELLETLAALRAAGVRRVVMEASSHSLHQGRLDAVVFGVAVYTTFSRDHLDYHGTMEAYLAAKLRLADLVAPGGPIVVNADDPAWRILRASPRITFGRGPEADVRAEAVWLHAGGSRFRMTGRFGACEVTLPLLGEFNITNALAAAAAALGLGHCLHDVAARLATAPPVPGRMEQLATSPCVILRDYAHTPDALERALAALRPLTSGRLIVLFGCGGDRDRGKRPLMGRVAERGADLVVVTSDNPRTEDPERIMDEIVAGMTRPPYLRISDRREAIARAIADARAGDTLLLAGKGHEDYQVVGERKFPMDEREIVRGLVGHA